MSEIQPSIPAAAAAADPVSSRPAHLSPQERLREITAGIEQGIQELFSSERYAQYLRTMSHFHRYSLNNRSLPLHLENSIADLQVRYPVGRAACAAAL